MSTPTIPIGEKEGKQRDNEKIYIHLRNDEDGGAKSFLRTI
jgi:hypothetical protein